MFRSLQILLFVFAIARSAFGQPYEVVTSYKTESPPTIDGKIDLGEWDAAGPAYVVSVEDAGTAFEDDPFGGPEDLSFQFRSMWAEPWTAYFLFEVTDDIAMEVIPGNRWEMDQVENFFDGNDLEGNSDTATFQWWDNDETYGKFGGSRFEGEFEGNTGAMSTFIDDLYTDGVGAFAVAVATETGNNADYIIEYAVSLEPMFDNFVFDDTPTGEAEKIVADSTSMKWRACVSDDDDFGDGTVGRSHTVCSIDVPDWRDTTAFSDLVFSGPFSGGTPGDFDGNGEFDAADIDALTAAIASGDASFDLNGDAVVDAGDRTVWITEIKNTWFGDANLDGEFNSSDFVNVFTSGKFEAGINASWAEGDWDGDGKFTTGDFVAAFTDGGFEVGPRGATQAVPEPSSLVVVTLAFLFGLRVRRK